MADRVDFYFRQRVTEAELDLALALLEKADRDLAADLKIYGIVSGAVPAPHSPVPDLTVDLTAPGRAYDNLGQRLFFGTGQTVDCAVDLVGIPTDVSTAGNERWLGIFLRFKRQLSDPRTDGNSQQVYFRRDESFEIVVRQAPEGAVGVAPKLALQADEVLLCDVRRRPGQTQIFVDDIDTSRRQAFIFAQATSVAVESGLWSILEPLGETAQAVFDEVDAELREHFTGAARRHAASAIDYAAHSYVGAGTVQSAINRLVDALASTASGTAGAARIGADAVPGTPNALAAGTADAQLSQLLGLLNAHLASVAGAHQASAVGATPFAHVSAANVQAQLQEIVADLQSANAELGAVLVGSAEIVGAPYAIAAGTVRSQLERLIAHLNAHLTSADHDGRYYRIGSKVADADRLDGRDSSAYSLAGHDHDDRYVRRIYSTSVYLDPNETQVLTTLVDRPDLVTVSYNLVSGSTPQETTYVLGARSRDLRCWVTKINVGGGDKDYRLSVQNISSVRLYVNVGAYRSDA